MQLEGLKNEIDKTMGLIPKNDSAPGFVDRQCIICRRPLGKLSLESYERSGKRCLGCVGTLLVNR